MFSGCGGVKKLEFGVVGAAYFVRESQSASAGVPVTGKKAYVSGIQDLLRTESKDRFYTIISAPNVRDIIGHPPNGQ
jgi:hypothetical protein